ncbi:MAG: hypothetical protein GY936_19270 [Ignavibacteriae bacterium]|nr:hypothetical protein [Ignavibacteriota bacterium]
MKNTVTTFLLLLIFVAVSFAQERKQEVKSRLNSTNSVAASAYDFTTGSSKYYGGVNGAVEIDTVAGVWGMIAGDANSDGAVDAVDKNDFWRVENGTTYDYSKNSDFNLDGNLDAVDKNDFWRVNNGTASQVPN